MSELKRKRRNGKYSIVRYGKNIEKLIELNRTAEEIVSAREQLLCEYQKTADYPDQFMLEVDDDEEYDVEQQWMDSCNDICLDLQMKATDSTLSLDKAAKVPVETQKDLVHNVGTVAASAHNISDATQTDDSLTRNPHLEQCAFQLERPKLPKFDGNVREYLTFKSDFRHAVESRYSHRDSIALLRTSLSGKPLDMITGVGNDYLAAWSFLDSMYGDGRFISDIVTQDIVRFSPLHEGEDARYCDLVHLVRRSYNTLKEVNRKNDMDNNHMIALIEGKMSCDDRKVWAREIERSGEEPTLEKLLKWMTSEMKARIRATADLRNDTQSMTGSVNHVNTGVGFVGKCWVCNSSDHWPDECPEFISKSPSDRLKCAQVEHVCFSCLKRGGHDHRVATCYRRRLCSKMYNNSPCTRYHHPLLHPDTTLQPLHPPHSTSSYRGDSNDQVLLPVISCDIVNEHGMCHSANVLFDSGSQLSVITNSLAQRQNLVGENTTVTITKVGGDKTELKTKVYHVSLRSLDDNTVHNVKLLGMPNICENQSDIHVPSVARQFGIPEHKLRRNRGSVDILLGVNHIRMHSGYVKTVGNLSARQSPLGWVICGTSGTNDMIQNAHVGVIANVLTPRDVLQKCDCNGTEAESTIDDRNIAIVENDTAKDEEEPVFNQISEPLFLLNEHAEVNVSVAQRDEGADAKVGVKMHEEKFDCISHDKSGDISKVEEKAFVVKTKLWNTRKPDSASLRDIALNSLFLIVMLVLVGNTEHRPTVQDNSDMYFLSAIYDASISVSLTKIEETALACIPFLRDNMSRDDHIKHVTYLLYMRILTEIITIDNT